MEKKKAGTAVVDREQVIWASALPPGNSAQEAELITVTQAFQLAEGKALSVYTDSRYAFDTAHVHGEIYQRRGLLTSEGEDIKYEAEILHLLKALFLPKKLSILHCPELQKGETKIAKGNRLADEVAKRATLGHQLLIATLLTDWGDSKESLNSLDYTDKDLDIVQKLGADYDHKRQRWMFQGKTVMPMHVAKELVSYLPKLTHLSSKKMNILLGRQEMGSYIRKRL